MHRGRWRTDPESFKARRKRLDFITSINSRLCKVSFCGGKIRSDDFKPDLGRREAFNWIQPKMILAELDHLVRTELRKHRQSQDVPIKRERGIKQPGR